MWGVYFRIKIIGFNFGKRAWLILGRRARFDLKDGFHGRKRQKQRKEFTAKAARTKKTDKTKNAASRQNISQRCVSAIARRFAAFIISIP